MSAGGGAQEDVRARVAASFRRAGSRSLGTPGVPGSAATAQLLESRFNERTTTEMRPFRLVLGAIMIPAFAVIAVLQRKTFPATGPRHGRRGAGSQALGLTARLRDLLDAPTALAACCGFDLCHKYILYLYKIHFVFPRRPSWL